MIDEATGRILARFAEENSTPENLNMLRLYLMRYGRPLRFRTHRSSLYRGNPRGAGTAIEDGGRSQIRRALAELDIEWSPLPSPEEDRSPGDFATRFFAVAKRELIRELGRAGARTRAEADKYMERYYLPAWRARHAAWPRLPDAHRPLAASHDLSSILSEVETRAVSDQGALVFHGATYLLPDCSLGGTQVEIEKRADGSVYWRSQAGRVALKPGLPPSREAKGRPHTKKTAPRRFNRKWMENFFNQPTAPLWRLLK